MQKIKLTVPDQVRHVLELFTKNGHEIYIVGGIVRDAILDRPLVDWDFTTDATPEEMLKLVPDSFYDNKYGTVGIKAEPKPYEVTTFRTEQGYSDSRHPDEVHWGETLEEDLKRRDFTINAVALKPDGRLDFEVIDPHGGVDDLKKKVVRTVGAADDRFGEDALRMMRAVRIAAQLRFNIEEETFAAIKRNFQKLRQIAWERIREELLKIMAVEYPADGYLLVRNTGLGEIVLPEMEAAFGVEQKSPGRHHIYDVGTHSVEALRHCPSPDPVTRLATLVHDAGKVKTQRIYADGLITFYNHEMESAKIAAYMQKDMDFLTALRTDDLVSHRMRYYTNPLNDVEGYLHSQKGGGTTGYAKPEDRKK